MYYGSTVERRLVCVQYAQKLFVGRFLAVHKHVATETGVQVNAVSIQSSTNGESESVAYLADARRQLSLARPAKHAEFWCGSMSESMQVSVLTNHFF